MIMSYIQLLALSLSLVAQVQILINRWLSISKVQLKSDRIRNYLALEQNETNLFNFRRRVRQRKKCIVIKCVTHP